MALLLEVSSVFGAFTEVADRRVDVFGYVWPVQMKYHIVVHEVLARVSRQFLVKGQLKEASMSELCTTVLTGPSSEAMQTKRL